MKEERWLGSRALGPSWKELEAPKGLGPGGQEAVGPVRTVFPAGEKGQHGAFVSEAP